MPTYRPWAITSSALVTITVSLNRRYTLVSKTTPDQAVKLKAALANAAAEQSFGGRPMQ